jgi:hypothetical protein
MISDVFLDRQPRRFDGRHARSYSRTPVHHFCAEVIMGVVISWVDFSSRLQGKVAKEVACTGCGEHYVYILEREASGSGTSLYGLDNSGAQERALSSAAAKLDDYLRNDFEIVPCPNCGTYQPEMVASLKRSHKMWIWTLGAGLMLLAGIVGLVTLFFMISGSLSGGTIAAAVVVVLGLTMTALCLFRVHRDFGEQYDPNAGDAEPRKEIGRSLAIMKKDMPRKR